MPPMKTVLALIAILFSQASAASCSAGFGCPRTTGTNYANNSTQLQRRVKETSISETCFSCELAENATMYHCSANPKVQCCQIGSKKRNNCVFGPNTVKFNNKVSCLPEQSQVIIPNLNKRFACLRKCNNGETATNITFVNGDITGNSYFSLALNSGCQ